MEENENDITDDFSSLFSSQKEVRLDISPSFSQPEWVKIKMKLLEEFTINTEAPLSPKEFSPERRFYTREVKEVFSEEQHYINEYKIISEIGKGSFSKVKLAQREIVKNEEIISQNFALKIMHKPTLKREVCAKYENKELITYNSLDLVFKELQLWSTLSHPNIVDFHEVIEAEDHDYLYTVLEYGDFGQISYWDQNNNLFSPNSEVTDFVSQLRLEKSEAQTEEEKGEEVAKVIFYDVSQALKYLHDKNITHRDVKIDNILFSKKDSGAKITDFNVSIKSESKESRDNNKEGTNAFMAPEYQEIGSEGVRLLPTDIYSLGISIFTYLNQSLPEKDSNFSIPQFSELINALLGKLGAENPDDRPTIQEVLEDEWFNSISSSNI